MGTFMVRYQINVRVHSSLVPEPRESTMNSNMNDSPGRRENGVGMLDATALYAHIQTHTSSKVRRDLVTAAFFSAIPHTQG